MIELVGRRTRPYFEGILSVPVIPFISLSIFLTAAYWSRSVPSEELALWVVFFSAIVSSVAGFAFSPIAGAVLFHCNSDAVLVVQILLIASLAQQLYCVWVLRSQIKPLECLPYVMGKSGHLASWSPSVAQFAGLSLFAFTWHHSAGLRLLCISQAGDPIKQNEPSLRAARGRRSRRDYWWLGSISSCLCCHLVSTAGFRQGTPAICRSTVHPDQSGCRHYHPVTGSSYRFHILRDTSIRRPGSFGSVCGSPNL